MSSSVPRPDADDLSQADGGSPSAPGTALVDDSRRVLVHLLQGPFLDGRRDPARYAQLLRDRAAIEARLADGTPLLLVPIAAVWVWWLGPSIWSQQQAHRRTEEERRRRELGR